MKELTPLQFDTLLSLRDDGPIVGDACALVRIGPSRRTTLRALERKGFARHFPTSDTWRITGDGKIMLTFTTGNDRKTMEFAELQKLLPQQCDKLPSPVEFRSAKIRARKRWVGFAWHDEGEADGSEPLLVIDSRESP